MLTKDGSKNVSARKRPENENLMRELKRHRLAKGMSMEKLAHRLGVATPTVGAWESGRNLPRPAIVPKLAQILDIDPLELTRIIAPDRSKLN